MNSYRFKFSGYRNVAQCNGDFSSESLKVYFESLGFKEVEILRAIYKNDRSRCESFQYIFTCIIQSEIELYNPYGKWSGVQVGSVWEDQKGKNWGGLGSATIQDYFKKHANLNSEVYNRHGYMSDYRLHSVEVLEVENKIKVKAGDGEDNAFGVGIWE